MDEHAVKKTYHNDHRRIPSLYMGRYHFLMTLFGSAYNEAFGDDYDYDDNNEIIENKQYTGTNGKFARRNHDKGWIIQLDGRGQPREIQFDNGMRIVLTYEEVFLGGSMVFIKTIDIYYIDGKVDPDEELIKLVLVGS